MKEHATSLTRVLLADSHPVSLEGMACVLKASSGLIVCGYASDSGELLEKCDRLSPDVVILGLAIPYIEESGLVRKLGKSKSHPRILCYSFAYAEEHLMDLIRMGIAGIVSKNSRVDELIRATTAVADGQSYFDTNANDIILRSGLRKASSSTSLFTERELRIIAMLCDGSSVKEVSDALSMNCRTVESIKVRIMQKISVRNVAGIVSYAIRNRLVTLDRY